jgi:hypothetical protein
VLFLGHCQQSGGLIKFLLGHSGSTLDIKSLILGNAGQRYIPGSLKYLF